MDRRAEQEYKQALDSLRYSSEGKERIMKNLMEQQAERQEQRPGKRKSIRPLRAALIAAALCLALVGTAFSAAHYFGVQIVNGAGENDYDFWTEGGIACYPVDSLSDELKKPENQGTYLTFRSWRLLEDFIGIDLMNNPVLDGCYPLRYSQAMIRGEDRAEGKYFVWAAPGLERILINGCFEMGDVDIDVEGYLYTERKTEDREEWDERFSDRSFVEGSQTSRESYTAKNGLKAQVITVEYPTNPNGYSAGHGCMAAVSINGIPFIIKTSSHNSMDEAREALYRILDGFVLE